MQKNKELLKQMFYNSIFSFTKDFSVLRVELKEFYDFFLN